MPAEDRTVVVVEDDELMRAAVESVLDASGYRPVLHGSAEAALGSGVLDRARCAILDVALPGMSGIELCRRMRAANMATPVIIMTARDARHLRKSAEELGVVALLVKPFSGRRLVHFVDQAMSRARQAEPNGAH